MTSAGSATLDFVTPVQVTRRSLEQAVTQLGSAQYRHWQQFLEQEAVVLLDDDAHAFLGSDADSAAGNIKKFSQAVHGKTIRTIRVADAAAFSHLQPLAAFQPDQIAELLYSGASTRFWRAGFSAPGEPLLAAILPLLKVSSRVVVADPYLFSKQQMHGGKAFLTYCAAHFTGTLVLRTVLRKNPPNGQSAPRLWDNLPAFRADLDIPDLMEFWTGDKNLQRRVAKVRFSRLIDSVLPASPNLKIALEIIVAENGTYSFHDRYLSFVHDFQNNDAPAIGLGIGRGVAAFSTDAGDEHTIVCRFPQQHRPSSAPTEVDVRTLELELR